MNKVTYREARCFFTTCIAELILFANSKGYAIALNEGMDRVTEKDPTTDHMKDSLHTLGLAQDLDLYRDGTYLRNTSDHQILGDYWEELGKAKGLPLTWGGRFNDGNHYSLSWGGKK